MEWILPFILAVIGSGSIYMVFESTDRGEYPPAWWIGWGILTAAGLAAISNFTHLRMPYIQVSSGVAIVFFIIGWLFKDDGEALPPAWMAVGVWISNGFLLLAGDTLSTPMLAGAMGVLGLGAWAAGQQMRNSERNFYDTGYSVSMVLFATAGLLLLHAIRSPLENLNEVVIPKYNEARATAAEMVQNFGSARTDAQAYHDRIVTDFAEEDPAFVAMADSYFTEAEPYITTAQRELEKAPRDTYPLQEKFNKNLETEIVNATQHAEQARLNAQLAIEKISGIGKLWADLETEYVQTYLWFEIADWWQSEAYDLATSKACYYGLSVTTIDTNGQVNEVIISDEADKPNPQTDWDSEGTNWRVFTVNDYADLVNRGIIPPMDKQNPSVQDVGYYLCGADPLNNQFGVLGEPTVQLIKERGSLHMFQEDEDSFVGNYDYGAWCVADASGKFTEIPEDQVPPENAEWCWYQPQGQNTGYYHRRSWNGSSYIYIQGSRRCWYCQPQGSWSGETLVPDRRMAEVNQTDASGLRRPADVGGGPGAGK